jgi:type IX secretion system substrate protein
MKKLGLSLLVCSIVTCTSHAQSITPQVINISGGSYAKGYYQLDWSVGELPMVDKMQDAGANLIITNGYIQPFTNYAHDVNNTRTFADYEVVILPNPTRDVLEVNFLARQRGLVGFRMFDMLGREVYNTSFTSHGNGNIVRIDMTRYKAGNYMLYIHATSTDAGQFRRSGSYKILKLN